MSLVFPNALAASSTRLALSRGTFWFGMVCLISALATLLLVGTSRESYSAWPSLLGLVVIALSGVAAASAGGGRALLVLAAIGALVGNVLYVAELLPRLQPTIASDSILLSLTKTAIIMFGAATARRFSGIAGVIVAAVIAEAPVVALSSIENHLWSLDVPALACFVVLLLTFALLDASRRRTRASEPILAKASADERAAAYSALVEHQSSALVHDTILNELAVVATIAPGTLSAAAREQLQSSIAILSLEQQFVPLAPAEPAGGALAGVVERARSLGLTITVSGELDAVGSLEPATARALALAALQCLTNVAAHSGTDVAELSVLETERELCVMVIDSGVGFTEAGTEDDRLGIKHSVRRRIEAVGGSVHIWSAPGAGTAVSLLVPRP